MKKKSIIIAIIVLIISLVLGGVVVAKQSSDSKVDKKISLGNKYLKEGKYQEAIIAFDKAIKIDHKNVDARTGKGKAYIALGKPEDAEKVLKEAISINSKKDEAYIVLAELYSEQGRFDEAIKILEKRQKVEKSDIINKKIELTKLIEESKKNYDAAIKQMSEKNYLGAIDTFGKVDKQDTKRYSDSQNKILECKKLYIQDNLNAARQNLNNKKFDEANNALANVFKIDATNAEGLKLKDEIAAAVQKQKDEEAAEAMKRRQNSVNKEEEYTPEMAIQLAKERDGVVGNDDIVGSAGNPFEKNGKKYYLVYLKSKSAMASGGTGTFDFMNIAKDGSVTSSY